MNRSYIYRGKENSEVIAKSKPKDIGRKEIVMRCEALRVMMKGRRWVKRRIVKLFKRNPNIMGMLVKEKGVRGLRRKSSSRVRGIGRIRANSVDTRLEYREMRIFSRRGVKTRRVWVSVEPLPLGVRISKGARLGHKNRLGK